MSSTYRDFVDSREAYTVQENLAYQNGDDIRAEYEPTEADWLEFGEWCDSLDQAEIDRINAELDEAWVDVPKLFEPEFA